MAEIRRPNVSRRAGLIALGVIVLGIAGLVLALAGRPANTREIMLAPLEAMPPFVQDAAPPVQEAYRFAAANLELVRQFPCFCGCVFMGHESNLDCYLREVQDDGTILFEEHASL